jgi:kinetochore protein Spc25, fungi type
MCMKPGIEENKSTATAISSLQSTLTTQQNLQQRELAERDEITAQIHKLQSRQSAQQQQRDKLQSAIAATQRQIENKLATQREYASKQDSQSALNAPELGFWETYLGLRFEGAGDEGVVRVVFVFPPSSKQGGEEREAVFELRVPETGSGGYEVGYMKPKIEREKVDIWVDRLNETREIGVILKGMRGLFAEEMK